MHANPLLNAERLCSAPRRYDQAAGEVDVDVRRMAVVVTALALAAALGTGVPAAAATNLTIEPITWNVIGLDSNDVTSGPNQFLVGARICNGGDVEATGVTATFVWESDNALISLEGPDRIELGPIASGACEDAYFLAVVARDRAAWLTTRRFRIDAAGDGLGTVSTPTPRELLVEKLISQNRNNAISLEGPAEVFVGQTVVYDVVAKTATNGYQQLESFLPFPPGMLRILSVERTYSAPPGATGDRVYADACGWDPDPSSPTYRKCVGPATFAGGKAGGDITTRYTVLVVGTGEAVLTDLIYDFSGTSYHYNADFGSPSLTVTARESIDLELAKSVDDAAPQVGEQVTFTLSLTNAGTATATGVVVTDLLPATLDFVSADATTGTYDPGSGTWDAGELGGGEVATLQIVAATTGDAPLTNLAEVTAADQPDVDSEPANGDPAEDDQASVAVDPQPPGSSASPAAPADGPQTGPNEIPVVGIDIAGHGRSAALLLASGWLLVVAVRRLEKR